MPQDTVDLALQGKVSLRDFAAAVDALTEFLQALTREAARGAKVNWVIEALEVNGARVSTRAEVEDEAESATLGPHLVHEARQVLRLRQAGTESAYTRKVKKPAGRLLYLPRRPGITQAFFITAEEEPLALAPPKSRVVEVLCALGSLRGQVQMLSSAGGLRFGLLEESYRKAVTCYLQEGAQETMRNVWGKHATVSGLVYRDAETGRPIAVRNVTSVSEEDEAPFHALWNARAALPGLGQGRDVEDLVRASRGPRHDADE